MMRNSAAAECTVTVHACHFAFKFTALLRFAGVTATNCHRRHSGSIVGQTRVLCHDNTHPVNLHRPYPPTRPTVHRINNSICT
eukprot:COSAG01_NODE_5192_length_4420_cov_38.410553_4_plen_83_part_00